MGHEFPAHMAAGCAAYYMQTGEAEYPMDSKPAPFVPPAPKPRAKPPSTLEMMRIVYRNPLELWGEPSYNEPYISVTGIGGPLATALSVTVSPY